MLPLFAEHLYSGYDILHWKPDPELMYHAAEQMQVPIERCILVDDSKRAPAPVSPLAFRSTTTALTHTTLNWITRW